MRETDRVSTSNESTPREWLVAASHSTPYGRIVDVEFLSRVVLNEHARIILFSPFADQSSIRSLIPGALFMVTVFLLGNQPHGIRSPRAIYDLYVVDNVVTTMSAFADWKRIGVTSGVGAHVS